MPGTSVGAKTLMSRCWAICLVGIILLMREVRAQYPDNNTSPCSHFKSVCRSRFYEASSPHTIR